jgi:acetyl esterase/lipase
VHRFSRVVVAAVFVVALSGAGVQGQAVVSHVVAPETKLLWPDGAPGARGSEDIDKPTLTVYLAPGENATKTGVVIAPGGGYDHLATEKEGGDYARWLNARGVTAFVLKYRLGPKYHYPVELEDAQRAIRMVRAHAAEYGVAAVDHVGMWGLRREGTWRRRWGHTSMLDGREMRMWWSGRGVDRTF